jgi:hypothetical protein
MTNLSLTYFKYFIVYIYICVCVCVCVCLWSFPLLWYIPWRWPCVIRKRVWGLDSFNEPRERSLLYVGGNLHLACFAWPHCLFSDACLAQDFLSVKCNFYPVWNTITDCLYLCLISLCYSTEVHEIYIQRLSVMSVLVCGGYSRRRNENCFRMYGILYPCNIEHIFEVICSLLSLLQNCDYLLEVGCCMSSVKSISQSSVRKKHTDPDHITCQS